MASPTLITPTTSTPKPLLLIRCNHSATTPSTTIATTTTSNRRSFLSLAAITTLSTPLLATPSPALAATDEEYAKETQEVIQKVRTTINMDKTDPNIANAVADLRETSNTWVAKYRREKALLGRLSFRDMYSALNAVSGHYVSFGPTSPIPAKRKVRILEEMDSVEKALSRGR
ncbi:twin-arginine translocation pathway, signal sequence, Photosystem II Pbs27 [Artemisia annua]|uniref:Twin-arginine translocation pathway, signal sequence, Photosystem II Pbs27 n=1 Tax=Artemisia annua TaxID=35608 RepID=A0A2U1P5M0_ARTAN|nr:twin-arginine translocation pathway, signal sequence, Photosystem II Pbs27 [Artemisia annua]